MHLILLSDYRMDISLTLASEDLWQVSSQTDLDQSRQRGRPNRKRTEIDVKDNRPTGGEIVKELVNSTVYRNIIQNSHIKKKLLDLSSF